MQPNQIIHWQSFISLDIYKYILLQESSEWVKHSPLWRIFKFAASVLHMTDSSFVSWLLQTSFIPVTVQRFFYNNATYDIMYDVLGQIEDAYQCIRTG
jgi:hypothetical protein